MSLPIAGGGAKTPTRSPTHEDVSPATLARLGLDLEDAADDAPLTPEQILDLAAERGKSVGEYYAAAVLAADVELAATRPIQLVFCAGTCQRWGAIACIERAVERWDARRETGDPGFDVVARKCLDRCDHAAVCEIRTPDGVSVLTETTPAKVDEALAQLLP
jgi:NADH:ubiquinone oxidoreductase subunit E